MASRKQRLRVQRQERRSRKVGAGAALPRESTTSATDPHQPCCPSGIAVTPLAAELAPGQEKKHFMLVLLVLPGAPQPQFLPNRAAGPISSSCSCSCPCALPAAQQPCSKETRTQLSLPLMPQLCKLLPRLLFHSSVLHPALHRLAWALLSVNMVMCSAQPRC